MMQAKSGPGGGKYEAARDNRADRPNPDNENHDRAGDRESRPERPGGALPSRTRQGQVPCSLPRGAPQGPATDVRPPALPHRLHRPAFRRGSGGGARCRAGARRSDQRVGCAHSFGRIMGRVSPIIAARSHAIEFWRFPFDSRRAGMIAARSRPRHQRMPVFRRVRRGPSVCLPDRDRQIVAQWIPDRPSPHSFIPALQSEGTARIASLPGCATCQLWKTSHFPASISAPREFLPA